MTLRLKPVAHSLSARPEFFGLEHEGWGLVIAWTILMRLIGDHILRVLLGFIPVSTVLTYASFLVLVNKVGQIGEPSLCRPLRRLVSIGTWAGMLSVARALGATF